VGVDVGIADGRADGVIVIGLRLGDLVGVDVGIADGVADELTEAVGLAVRSSPPDGLADGLTEAVGLAVSALPPTPAKAFSIDRRKRYVGAFKCYQGRKI
jgi:hypothetical protein